MPILRIKEISTPLKDASQAFSVLCFRHADEEHWGDPDKDFGMYETEFLAMHGEQIVGRVTIRVDTTSLEINTFQVHPDFQRQGIASRLIGFLESYSRERGFYKIWCWTVEGWDACLFYEKCGFIMVARLEQHYFDRTGLIYSKILS